MVFNLNLELGVIDHSIIYNIGFDIYCIWRPTSFYIFSELPLLLLAPYVTQGS